MPLTCKLCLIGVLTNATSLKDRVCQTCRNARKSRERAALKARVRAGTAESFTCYNCPKLRTTWQQIRKGYCASCLAKRDRASKKRCQGPEARAKRKAYLASLNGGGPCCKACGWVPHCPEAWLALEFHHRDPAEMSFRISSNLWQKKAEAEAKKCDLLCARCHNLVEAGIMPGWDPALLKPRGKPLKYR